MEEGDKVKFELVYYKNMKRLNDISIKYLVAKLGFHLVAKLGLPKIVFKRCHSLAT